MQPDEKKLWNRKYAEGSHDSVEPEGLLVRTYTEYLAARPPGFALDVAGGTGRHAFWLARKGWRGKVIDNSWTGDGLAKNRLQTRAAGAKGPLGTHARDP